MQRAVKTAGSVENKASHSNGEAMTPSINKKSLVIHSQHLLVFILEEQLSLCVSISRRKGKLRSVRRSYLTVHHEPENSLKSPLDRITYTNEGYFTI